VTSLSAVGEREPNERALEVAHVQARGSADREQFAENLVGVGARDQAEVTGGAYRSRVWWRLRAGPHAAQLAQEHLHGDGPPAR
jgi:hypothetical protein